MNAIRKLIDAIRAGRARGDTLTAVLSVADVDAAEAELAEMDEWRRALQSLTPGGSEFTEPQECEKYIRNRDNERWELLKKVKQQRDAYQVTLIERTERLERIEQAARACDLRDAAQLARYWNSNDDENARLLDVLAAALKGE